MTKIERAKAQALARCRLLPGSFDKRFIRTVNYLAANSPDHVLTEKQRWLLDVMVHRYRRQLGGVDLPFEIPLESPALEAYAREPKPKRQASLL